MPNIKDKNEKKFNLKNSASNFPTIGLNRTNINEDNNYKKDKDKEVIKNIISNFDEENDDIDALGQNKRISSIHYPVIMNKLKTIATNKYDDQIKNEKYNQNDFKNFKNEKKYGKKLINVLRRRNDNKKD